VAKLVNCLSGLCREEMGGVRARAAAVAIFWTADLDNGHFIYISSNNPILFILSLIYSLILEGIVVLNLYPRDNYNNNIRGFVVWMAMITETNWC